MPSLPTVRRPRRAPAVAAAVALGALGAPIAAPLAAHQAAAESAGSCPTAAAAAVPGEPHALAMVPSGSCGYWIATTEGAVAAFGTARSEGDLRGQHLNGPVIGMTPTPSGAGYWLLGADGGIFTFGDATFQGSTGGMHLNAPVVAMAATPSGHGYWLVAADGGIFTFGDATFEGSTGGMHLNAPVVGIATTPSGHGYRLVAADGGIFSFGDATFEGSMGSTALAQPVVGMTASSDGSGYRMVARDGGIFSFGAPFYGSLGSTPPAKPIVAMAPTADGGGYGLLDDGGSVHPFGDAADLGAANQTDPSLVEQLATVGLGRQALVVDAPTTGSTTATLTAYADDGQGWHQVLGPIAAYDGYAGWEPGPTRREGDGSSPEGAFPVETDRFYGNAADPGGLHVPYQHLVPGDYWDENPSSSTYNTFQATSDTNCGSNPFGGDTECLWQETAPYPYFADIGFNPAPTSNPVGAGIFLHASTGGPTAGCISVPVDDLLTILRWLDPAAHPEVVMAPDAVLRQY
ncbi:MAG TPA: L,D-transpeptidase family protein [Acidimicrobiales bacterium]|nr:L,D-transpeptidase family protein [Acidimicrobiales bacterium]